jgi:hypothetical protein
MRCPVGTDQDPPMLEQYRTPPVCVVTGHPSRESRWIVWMLLRLCGCLHGRSRSELPSLLRPSGAHAIGWHGQLSCFWPSDGRPRMRMNRLVTDVWQRHPTPPRGHPFPLPHCSRPRSWRRPLRLPLHHAPALQHWKQEACKDSSVMLKGHKWPRREARYMISLLGLRMVRSDGRIHALGRFHIGGGAYCVWAYPPNFR